MPEIETLLAFLIYALAFLGVAWLAGRLELAGRLAAFFVLFYSVAPAFAFSGFQFFEYEVDYSWRASVFACYAAMLLIFFVLLLFFVRRNGREHGAFSSDNQRGLQLLWWLALVAWLVDTVFNWRYFSLPKHEYILSLPEQTKNLFLFSIPAKEMLVGAAFFNPFRSRWVRFFCIAIAVLALLQSLVIGVRHVALLFILLLVLPKVRVFGILILVFVFTFLGEFSNVVKLLFSFSSGIQQEIFSYAWWAGYFQEGFGVSGEQKAVLSNLLIKLDNAELFDFGRIGQDLMLGLPLAPLFSKLLGHDFVSAAVALSDFVGTLEGQGTAYSMHLVMMESFGLAVLWIFCIFLIGRWVFGSFLFIFFGEIMYSVMRNGADYWIYQAGKMMFLIALVFSLEWLARVILFNFKSGREEGSNPMPSGATG